MGSWKIMAIFWPRMARISFSLHLVRSRPSNWMEPALMRAVSASSRRMVMEVTLLPLPDSPTMPRISPFSTVKLTPRTAWTSPEEVMKEVLRPSTLRISSIVLAPPYFLSLGSSASRRPSPTKLKANMMAQIISAGMNSSWGLVRRLAEASLHMVPRLARGGCRPMPR